MKWTCERSWMRRNSTSLMRGTLGGAMLGANEVASGSRVTYVREPQRTVVITLTVRRKGPGRG